MNIWKSAFDHGVKMLKTFYGAEVSVAEYPCDFDNLWEIRVNGSFVCVCKADYYEANIAVQSIYGTMSHIRMVEAMKNYVD